MKIFLMTFFSIFLISGCVEIPGEREAKEGAQLDAELVQKKDIIKTLEAFDKYYDLQNREYFGYTRIKDDVGLSLSEKPKLVLCYGGRQWRYTDDECKLYLRNNKYDSKISYFNYKRYLPENIANNEAEFVKLFQFYKGYDGFIRNEYGKKLDACEDVNLITVEKEQCKKEAYDWFYAWAISGGARKQTNLAQKAEQKKKEQQAINKERHEEQLADCKQAKEKVAVRLKQIKTALGLNVNEKNIQYSLEGKVVDFTNEGIMISSDCSGIWANGWILGDIGVMAAANCTEERWFIYTKNTDYATGEKFSNKGRLYKKAGNYKYTTITGSINSVPAFRETPYMFSEVNYKTYLKDKSIQKCD